MKRTILLLGLVLVSALVGCDGGGLFNPADAINPYGFIFKLFTNANAAPLPTDVRSVVYDSTNQRLFVGANPGLYTAAPNADPPTATLVDNATLNGKIIQCLLIEKSGNLLIGTNVGLFRRNKDDGAVVEVEAASFNGKSVVCLAQQDADTLWIGLAGQANPIARIANNVVTLYGAAQQMTANTIWQIHADSSRVLVAATGDANQGGLFKFTNNAFSKLDSPFSTNGATLVTVLDTTWYVGGVNKGLQKTTDQGDTWTVVLSDTSNITPYQILLDDGKYWVSSNKGLYLSYNLTDFHLFNTANRLGKDYTRQLASAPSMIWATAQLDANAGEGLIRGVFAGD